MDIVYTTPSAASTSIYKATHWGNGSHRGGLGWDLWNYVKKISKLAAASDHFSVYADYVTFHSADVEEAACLRDQICEAGAKRMRRRPARR